MPAIRCQTPVFRHDSAVFRLTGYFRSAFVSQGSEDARTAAIWARLSADERLMSRKPCSAQHRARTSAAALDPSQRCRIRWARSFARPKWKRPRMRGSADRRSFRG